MKKHELKILLRYFEAIISGDKTFEIRLNDRGFQKGDTIHLRPWSCEYSCFIEPYDGIQKKITYVHSGLGMQENYVVLGLGGI